MDVHKVTILSSDKIKIALTNEMMPIAKRPIIRYIGKESTKPCIGNNFMNLESRNLEDYLYETEVIDFSNKAIINVCRHFKGYSSRIELIKSIYKFVRDSIMHSGDITADEVTVKASDVLKRGHGICHAKSNLLAAMLRYFKVPAGFCYQKLYSDYEPVIELLHCLNAVYLEDYNKWIRLDARGNKEGINAQFDIHTEKIAWQVNKDLGEKDYNTIYTHPNKRMMDFMKSSKDRCELWENLDYSAVGSVSKLFALE